MSPFGISAVPTPERPAARPGRRAITGVAVGALASRAAYGFLAGADSPAWRRRNYRGTAVTLAAGPALIAGTALGAAVACPPGGAPARRALLIAVGSASLAGAYDDRCGTPAARGLRGHLHALGTGAVTTGAVKIVGIGAGAVLAADRLGWPTVDAAIAAGLIAGSANLVNLLDLRPGRAAKVALLIGGLLVGDPSGWPCAGAVGAAAALLPVDLAERGMLGDAGANALGAALGTALTLRTGRRAATIHLAVIGALTLASERISFTAVIDDTPVLRWFDRLGRTA